MNLSGKRTVAAALFGAILLAVVGSTAASQHSGNSQNQAPVSPPSSNPDVKAKLDHEQNLKDAARLAQLAAEVKQELESGSQYTLSIATLKKVDEMEKLCKKLSVRLKSDNSSAPAPTSPYGGTKK